MSISNGQGLSLPGSSGGGGGASDFTDLLDTPTSYLAAAGYRVVVNGTTDGLEFITDSFLNLSDTPSSYAAQAGKYLKVNAGATALEFVDAPTDTDTFIGLTDTPANFTGSAFKVPAVNSGETALEFVTTLSTDNFLHIQDQKTDGTSGGSSSAGVNVRVLNTVVTNTITGASLSSNQVTLPAGTYVVRAETRCYKAGVNVLRLYNVTDTAYISTAEGLNSYNSPGGDVISSASLFGTFTLAASKAIELRHNMSTAKASNGLGDVNGVSGMTEYYTDLRFWRVS